MGAMKTTLEEWKDPKKLEKVTKWAKDGLTNAEIAHNIGISEPTIYRWFKEYEPLREALDEGKAHINQIVVNTMLEKIKGYTYDEVTEERDESGQLVTTKIVKKVVPPDTTAMIFWLKNRMAKDFRDTQLTQAQARKIEIETQILEKELAALNGEQKDTSMLQSLINIKDKFK